jgi:putative ABC transport system permease protein
MKNISLKKIIRDLMLEKSRTFIVLFAIILGAFSVSMMNTAFTLLNNNLKENYLRTNPASFTIIGKNIDRNILINNPDIASIEYRKKIMGRIRISENVWYPLWVFLVDDFNNMRINTFKTQSGMNPKAGNEILIERTADKIFKYQVNDKYDIKLKGLPDRIVTLTGITHDPGQAPSWMEGIVYGYMKKDSVLLSNEMTEEIKVIISENRFDLNHIQDVLLKTIKMINDKGGNIERTEILPPGKHIHETQMNSLMFLLEMFGILVLFLSCFLIINMISAIMAKQMQQIGIMKAIGAKTLKISGIYSSIVLLMGIIAGFIAVPLGIQAGFAYSKFTASMLNFEIINSVLPHSNVLFQFSISIIVPIIITFFPIYRSSRISVHSALNDQGVSATVIQKEKIRKRPYFIPEFSNSLRLGIKNALRRKGRLILTSLTLILGGSFFITAFNIRSSANNTINAKYDNQKYDLMVYFNKPYDTVILRNEFQKNEGINNIEFWKIFRTTIYNDNGLESPIYELKCIKPNTRIYTPEMITGNWLEESDSGVVINHAVSSKYPNLSPGDNIKLKVNGVINTFQIKGITREVFGMPAIYVNENRIGRLTLDKDFYTLSLIGMKNDYKIRTEELTKQIESQFQKDHFDIGYLERNDQSKKRIVDHLLVMTTMLIMITFLLIIVGGLGIITTMSINIIERRREIGILRAIGVTNKSLYKIFLYEGILMSIVSWFLSILISLYLSYYLGNKFFHIFFETSINYMISPTGIILWLFIALLFGSLAVFIPARNAGKLSVNSILAYE